MYSDCGLAVIILSFASEIIHENQGERRSDQPSSSIRYMSIFSEDSRLELVILVITWRYVTSSNPFLASLII